MKKAIVVMNEAHSLLPEQEKILGMVYEGFDILPVPAQGWDIGEMIDRTNELHDKACEEGIDIIFVSPIPLMIRELTEMALCPKGTGKRRYRVKLFHNDRREKKELPNGRIISVIAQTGWQLV